MNRLIIFLVVMLPLATFAQRAVPGLWGHRVHDESKILHQQTVDDLEIKLARHQDSTGNQIAILIIPSLDGDDLESYSMRVAHDEWKLGQSNNNNGVLLLIVTEDRRMRIEVGMGLEGVLTDALTSRIIRNEMAPRFREHDYDAGVTAAVEAIIAAIGNEYVSADYDGFESNELDWKERLMIGAFLFVILGLFTFFALFVPGCGGWGLYAFLIPFYAVFPWIVIGLDAGMMLLGSYIVFVPIFRLIILRTAWGKRISESLESSGSSGGSGGGWSSGSGWSSGGSWSSGSSGGFSGGGGSFGGGGSSGSW